MITPKEDKLLEQLNEILLYGERKLLELKLSPIKPKKYILLGTMGAVQSYTTAILRLMSSELILDKAAQVIFRSLIESYINLNYIFSDKTNSNAIKFISESEREKIDFAKKHKNLWLRYPKWKLEFGNIKSAGEWDQFILDKEKIIYFLEKKYKLQSSKLVSLLDRAISFDTQYKTNKKVPIEVSKRRLQRKSMEKYYLLFYKYFSQLAHLTMPGLERFIKFDFENSIILLEIYGKRSEINSIVSVTYIIYMTILAHFLKQFKMYDAQEFEKFKNLTKKIIKN